ncbi:retropepsin-like aspartic protease family protein [Pseudoprimorskyibacter insulae]|uniref:Peptidase A2 domain-containing protein n=1 Tax=Pseudoprimorskyibacter insulae TaxID=1695997 RepID=A0A2R8AVX1_9RHOB|nr:TIGR02281 family clan AA aspartic protease [Pseudoprimorskyibacter insulae]SPF80181.1 hypothetical protein PRI8871_01987 [Pseudoprimorskyibacter insulae]
MSGEQFGNLTYLVLLLAMLSVGLIARGRGQIRQHLKAFGQWFVIIAIIAVGVGLWGDVRTRIIPQQTVFSEAGRIELPRAPDGHYYATLGINGAEIPFVIDTGASNMVLTQDDAKAAGVPLERLSYFGQANTANGTVRTAPIRLNDVSFGPFEDSNVRALVNQGDMDKSLLGMSYLQRFSRIEISNNTLILER